MTKETPKEVIDARPHAIDFATKIGALANDKWGDKGCQMAGVIASITFQNIAVSIATQVFEPGSEDGEKFLLNLLDASKRDMLERWHGEDLKHHFGRGKRK